MQIIFSILILQYLKNRLFPKYELTLYLILFYFLLVNTKSLVLVSVILKVTNILFQFCNVLYRE